MKKRGKISKPVTFTVPAECGKCGYEVEFIADVDYTPEDPGCHTMRNGDPGWPSSPAECDYVGDGAYQCPKCMAEIEIDPSTIEDAYLQMIEDSKHDYRED